MTKSEGERALQQAEAAYARGEFESARRLFEEAAELGATEALYYLGVIYQDGDGVEVDSETAKEFLQRFIRKLREEANAGHCSSQLRLGKMLQFGDQVLKDEHEGLKWIRTSAENNYAPAQYHLSCLYAYGWCAVDTDIELRDVWLDKAANAGLPEAMYQKGVILANRYLVDEDGGARAPAVMWLERAARSGFEGARAALELVTQRES